MRVSECGTATGEAEWDRSREPTRSCREGVQSELGRSFGEVYQETYFETDELSFKVGQDGLIDRFLTFSLGFPGGSLNKVRPTDKP